MLYYKVAKYEDTYRESILALNYISTTFILS